MSTFHVDDRDPSVIYSGHWGLLDNDLAYEGTVTWVADNGTAKISFVGSSIGVYGTNWADSSDRQPAPACLYTIDEGTPVRLTFDRTATTKWGQLFFQSPVLPKTSHVLTIEYDDGAQANFTALSLDFFRVTVLNGSLPSILSTSFTTSFLSSTTTTPSTTPNSPVLTPSSYSMESSSLSPTSGATPGVTTVLVQGTTTPKLPIAPIIGGALGALTLICTVFLILYLRRRLRDGHSDKNIGPPPLAIGRLQISPYNISQLQDDGKGKAFVGTKTGMTGMAVTQITTSNFAAGTVQRTAEPAPAAASISSTLGTIMGSNNLGGMLPTPGDQPPSYQESFRPK